MIADIADKLERGERLALEDGVRLFEHPDLLAVALANRERERRHGDLTYYNYNIRIEATNVCVASCLFCSFARLRPAIGSYTMSLEDAWGEASPAPSSAAHRNPRRQRPASRSAVRLLPGAAARLQAHPSRHPPQMLHRCRDRLFRRPVRHDRRAGPARADAAGLASLPGGALRSSPSVSARRSATTKPAPIAGCRFTASRIGSA